jgi:hypothetical protein
MMILAYFGGVLLSSLIAYFLIRLYWIKQFQLVVLVRSNVMYMALPHWRYMMWKRWWVWDDIYFLPNPEDLRHE